MTAHATHRTASTANATACLHSGGRLHALYFRPGGYEECGQWLREFPIKPVRPSDFLGYDVAAAPLSPRRICRMSPPWRRAVDTHPVFTGIVVKKYCSIMTVCGIRAATAADEADCRIAARYFQRAEKRAKCQDLLKGPAAFASSSAGFSGVINAER